MKCTRFEVRNFKGIRHLSLDLAAHPQGRIIALVGLNESGKTTILEALDYLQLGINDSDPLDILGLNRDDPHALIPISERSNFNGSIEITVTVELDDDDKETLRQFLSERSFHVASHPTSFTVKDTYNFQDSTYEGRKATWRFNPTGIYKRARKVRPLLQFKDVWLETIAFLRARMPTIWYFPNFLFDFPRRIYLDSVDSEDSKERFYRNLLTEILSAVDSAATLDRHISQRISSERPPDKTALNQLLLELGRRITDDVFESWNEIFQRPPSTKAIFTPGTDGSGRRYLEMSIEDQDGLYYIDERSLGFRWFFVFSLVTKFKRGGVSPSQDIIYLFDEPASNLHAGAQSQLLTSLEQLSTDCTIIYTTHSHHLINPHWLENTYIVRNKGFDFDSAISDYTSKRTDIIIERYRSFANKHPDQTRYFQPILDVLDYKPSQLEMVADVVMVEGKNDFYTLAYMHELAINGKANGIQIVPGNGAGSLDSVIRLYVGWAKNFVVLLDSDKEGEKQKQRYLDTFGPILDGRLYTLGDLCPELKGKGMEEAFEKKDRDDMVAATYPNEPYSKARFNRSIQECLVTKRFLTMSPTTSQRFKDIFSRLSDVLSNKRTVGRQRKWDTGGGRKTREV